VKACVSCVFKFTMAMDTMSGETTENYVTTETAVVPQRNFRFNEDRLQKTKNLFVELIHDFKKEYHLD
jgi:hypothetical protein